MTQAAAKPKRPSPYRRGQDAGRIEERDRWIRAVYVALQCTACGRVMIAGEPACSMCAPVKRMAEDDVVVEVTHRCPPNGAAVTSCCKRTPFELPRTDRMTANPRLVNCRGGA